MSVASSGMGMFIEKIKGMAQVVQTWGGGGGSSYPPPPPPVHPWSVVFEWNYRGHEETSGTNTHLCQVVLVNSPLEADPLFGLDCDDFLHHSEDVGHLLDWHHLLLPTANSQRAKAFDSLQYASKVSTNRSSAHTSLNHSIACHSEFISTGLGSMFDPSIKLINLGHTEILQFSLSHLKYS